VSWVGLHIRLGLGAFRRQTGFTVESPSPFRQGDQRRRLLAAESRPFW